MAWVHGLFSFLNLPSFFPKAGYQLQETPLVFLE